MSAAEKLLVKPVDERALLLRHARDREIRTGSIDDVVHSQNALFVPRLLLLPDTPVSLSVPSSLDALTTDQETHITYDTIGTKRPEDCMLLQRDGKAVNVTVSSVLPYNPATGEANYNFSFEELARTYAIGLPAQRERAYFGRQPQLALTSEFTVWHGKIIWPKMRISKLSTRPCIYDDDLALQNPDDLPDHMKDLLSVVSERRPSMAVRQLLNAQAQVLARFFKQEDVAASCAYVGNVYRSRPAEELGLAPVNASLRVATNIFNVYQATQWMLDKPHFNGRMADRFNDCVSQEIVAENIAKRKRHMFSRANEDHREKYHHGWNRR